MTSIIHTNWNQIVANFRDLRGVTNTVVLSAMHEAGHAAMAIWAGADLELVSIRSTPKFGGRTEWSVPDIGRRRTDDEALGVNLSEYQIVMAGSIAEELLDNAIRSQAYNNLGRPSWEMDAADLKKIDERSGGVIRATGIDYAAEARRVLRQYEDEVDYLATALIYRIDLTGGEARSLCKGLAREGRFNRDINYGTTADRRARFVELKRLGFAGPDIDFLSAA